MSCGEKIITRQWKALICLTIVMVVQSLEKLEKSGEKNLVRENLKNLEKWGNFTERAKNNF